MKEEVLIEIKIPGYLWRGMEDLHTFIHEEYKHSDMDAYELKEKIDEIINKED